GVALRADGEHVAPLQLSLRFPHRHRVHPVDDRRRRRAVARLDQKLPVLPDQNVRIPLLVLLEIGAADEETVPFRMRGRLELRERRRQLEVAFRLHPRLVIDAGGPRRERQGPLVFLDVHAFQLVAGLIEPPLPARGQFADPFDGLIGIVLRRPLWRACGDGRDRQRGECETHRRSPDWLWRTLLTSPARAPRRSPSWTRRTASRRARRAPLSSARPPQARARYGG